MIHLHVAEPCPVCTRALLPRAVQASRVEDGCPVCGASFLTDELAVAREARAADRQARFVTAVAV